MVPISRDDQGFGGGSETPNALPPLTIAATFFDCKSLVEGRTAASAAQRLGANDSLQDFVRRGLRAAFSGLGKTTSSALSSRISSSAALREELED
jgi:hypothetical protein